jgi:hypothetical protein
MATQELVVPKSIPMTAPWTLELMQRIERHSADAHMAMTLYRCNRTMDARTFSEEAREEIIRNDL